MFIIIQQKLSLEKEKEKIGKFIKDAGFKRFYWFMEVKELKRWAFETVSNSLKDNNIEFLSLVVLLVINFKNCSRRYKIAKMKKFEAILSVGGGSVLR